MSQMCSYRYFLRFLAVSPIYFILQLLQEIDASSRFNMLMRFCVKLVMNSFGG